MSMALFFQILLVASALHVHADDQANGAGPKAVASHGGCSKSQTDTCDDVMAFMQLDSEVLAMRRQSPEAGLAIAQTGQTEASNGPGGVLATEPESMTDPKSLFPTSQHAESALGSQLMDGIPPEAKKVAGQIIGEMVADITQQVAAKQELLCASVAAQITNPSVAWLSSTLGACSSRADQLLEDAAVARSSINTSVVEAGQSLEDRLKSFEVLMNASVGNLASGMVSVAMSLASAKSFATVAVQILGLRNLRDLVNMTRLDQTIGKVLQSQNISQGVLRDISKAAPEKAQEMIGLLNATMDENLGSMHELQVALNQTLVGLVDGYGRELLAKVPPECAQGLNGSLAEAEETIGHVMLRLDNASKEFVMGIRDAEGLLNRSLSGNPSL